MSIRVNVGIDVGSIGLKVAVRSDVKREIDGFSDYNGFLISDYHRIHSDPAKTLNNIIDKVKAAYPANANFNFYYTGSSGRFLADTYNSPYINEFKALLAFTKSLHPNVKSIMEIGGESSKFISLSNSDGSVGIENYELTGECAAGTGSFLDQQSNRLAYNIEEVGKIALSAKNTPRIAGRCSVFAKSDMIHAQQKGASPDEILKGLCRALVLNFKSTLIKSNSVKIPVLFVGGVAMNEGVAHFMRELLDINDECIIPDNPAHIGAIGASLIAENQEIIKNLKINTHKARATNLPLSMEGVYRIPEKRIDLERTKRSAYLGVDIGSVSTNLVLLNEDFEILKDIYLPTKGRPIEVVNDGLSLINKEFSTSLNILGVGTTGSGRELIGELIGADCIRDEITAHKVGATFVAKEYLAGESVDTIFEIGGQDSKYISIEDGIIVDFAMNEACAAGTGSFLEEQAEKLKINIKGEFAKLSLASVSPLTLGERCTVFMELDLNSHLKMGEKLPDILAGLAYSVALNYINKVVKGRKIGKTIFFQGGTAYNDAVAAAFSIILNKRIIVPPYCGVVGALGMALISKEEREQKKYRTKFRGFDIEGIEYRKRDFVCKSCPNECDVREFNIAGEKSFWGDKCSIKYRKKTKIKKKAYITDLFLLKDELLTNYENRFKESLGDKVVGIPRAMYHADNFPFWGTFLSSIGFNVVVSEKTSKGITQDGSSLVVSDPCYPIKVAHGHIKNLINTNVDYIFVPNILNKEPYNPKKESHLCIWGQTLPFMVKGNIELKKYEERFLIPTLNFRFGMEYLACELANFFQKFNVKKNLIQAAVKKAYREEKLYISTIRAHGEEALQTLNKEKGVVMIGRPYNLYDRDVNLNIPFKLRENYGINIIPLDMLFGCDGDISHINDNMFWHYGHNIMKTTLNLAKSPNLHLIYLTNFKCGPDSYIKHYINEANGKPFLVLQFDGHGNDAGYITRCEAYLTSKGLI